jgi:hypothetical protein
MRGKFMPFLVLYFGEKFTVHMTEQQVNGGGRRGSVLHSGENFSPFLTEPEKGGGLGKTAFNILSNIQWEMALSKQV